MDLHHINSSLIAAAGYDAKRQILVVLFNSGKAYEYYGVPPETYQQFETARSKGRFLNKEIIGQFKEAVFQGWPEGAADEARRAQVRIQYVTDENGEKVAAILPIDLFYKIIDHI